MGKLTGARNSSSGGAVFPALVLASRCVRLPSSGQRKCRASQKVQALQDFVAGDGRLRRRHLLEVILTKEQA